MPPCSSSASWPPPNSPVTAVPARQSRPAGQAVPARQSRPAGQGCGRRPSTLAGQSGEGHRGAAPESRAQRGRPQPQGAEMPDRRRAGRHQAEIGGGGLVLEHDRERGGVMRGAHRGGQPVGGRGGLPAGRRAISACLKIIPGYLVRHPVAARCGLLCAGQVRADDAVAVDGSVLGAQGRLQRADGCAAARAPGPGGRRRSGAGAGLARRPAALVRARPARPQDGGMRRLRGGDARQQLGQRGRHGAQAAQQGIGRVLLSAAQEGEGGRRLGGHDGLAGRCAQTGTARGSRRRRGRTGWTGAEPDARDARPATAPGPPRGRGGPVRGSASTAS